MQPDEPQVVQPFPVPTSVVCGIAKQPEGNLVVMQIMQPTGTTFVFMPPDFASALVGQMKEQIKEARKPTLHIAHGLPDGPSMPLNGAP